ncbi:MAG: hypothetical protein J5879_01825 [Clostridia bacterium]|nr:hypothetical protein [Clostridia bacterium]
MRYSDKLNGYWEEGYHYYFDIRKNKFTLRDASKKVKFETWIKYDAKRLESGERTELQIGEKMLATTYKGEPMWYITGLYYENGEIHMDTHYTITGDDHYVLKKVDHDPFYEFLIRDDEYLKRLRGEWVRWNEDGNTSNTIEIKGNEIRFLFEGRLMEKCKFHVLSYRSSPDRVYLNNYDLTVSGLYMFSQLDVLPDMLTGYEMVCDMDMPLSVYARRDMLDKITVPAAALKKPRNTMVYDPSERSDGTPLMDMKSMIGMGMGMFKDEEK